MFTSEKSIDFYQSRGHVHGLGYIGEIGFFWLDELLHLHISE
jgi:hypothetical protein